LHPQNDAETPPKFFSPIDIMNKTIEETKQIFIDNIFKLVGMGTMEDAKQTAMQNNYQFGHEMRINITKKLKKEGIKKCHIDTVQFVLSGFELEDTSKPLSTEPKYTRKLVPAEEFLQTNIPYISYPRNWTYYEEFMKRDVEKRCEKIK